MANPPEMSTSQSAVTVRVSALPSSTMLLTSRSMSHDALSVISSPRVRAQTDSALLNLPASSSHPLNRVSASPSINPPTSASTPVLLGEALKSTFRARSRSQAVFPDVARAKAECNSNSLSGVSSYWWNRIQFLPRPWEDRSQEGNAVPVEQSESWKRTKETVTRATASALGIVGPIALETLAASVDLLEFAPVPGLQSIAKALLNIWEAVQEVDTNRLAFLRLTQRCATLLLSVRDEIHAAGDAVCEELTVPLRNMERSFNEILSLAEVQGKMPFLKRYLRREETAREISHCHIDLDQALTLFSTSVQIRTLKLVQSRDFNCSECCLEPVSERSPNLSSAADATPCGSTITTPGLPPSSSHSSLATPTSSETICSSQTTLSILSALRELQTLQNQKDERSDLQDLRQLMRAALQTGSDSDMVCFLQIAREEMLEAIKTLQRTLESGNFETPSGNHDADQPGHQKDTLHQEFIESGIDALRRMSKGAETTTLPSWTITKFEVDAGQKIGIGSFSDVFKGTWKGRTVAIKVLAESTPQKLFVREMEVWKTLKHPNVLQLYGASSASCDPPWFFVSPYEKNGSLVEFLKRIAMYPPYGRADIGLGLIVANLPNSRSRGSFGKGCGKVLKEGDIYRIMQEISKGMEYLHRRGVLHGDLKASNVLVDDDCRCVISDFGQSEMKSEASRISGIQFRGGTLRWQSPELMGGLSTLTPAIDVYAYAISCIEILSMGEMPWPLMDDDAVRFFVLKENSRPVIPPDFTSPALCELLRLCWHSDPNARPSFSTIIAALQELRDAAGPSGNELLTPQIPELPENEEHLSPDMCPTTPQSPRTSSPTLTSTSVRSSLNASFHNWDFVKVPTVGTPTPRVEEEIISNESLSMPQPVLYKPSYPPSSTTSSYASSTELDSDEDIDGPRHDRYDSPTPQDHTAVESRNERRYRLLLNHKFHPSLTLPLWEPVSVQLGDVGYLSKPSGTFVTLFNAFKPDKTSNGLTAGMPSIAGYGNVSRGSQRQDKRNAAQRGIDAFSGLLTFRSKSDIPVSRRESFLLRAGHKSAHMYTETTEYQYIKKLKAPKAWFKANAGTILNIYGAEHNIQKEEIFLVIGALQTPNYALFVSHRHPDGQAHFNVFSSQRKGQPWGTFTTDTKVPAEQGGPCYDEPIHEEHISASKVSSVGCPQKAVLIARLRFKPDVLEPTSL